MPAITSRTREMGLPCPHCQAPLRVREIATAHPTRPNELGRWVTAHRYCSAGCALLASDFEFADDYPQ